MIKQKIFEEKGFCWKLSRDNQGKEMVELLDWKRVMKILSNKDVSLEQKREKMGLYAMEFLFADSGDVLVNDYHLFCRSFGLEPKGAKFFEDEKMRKINFSYRIRPRKLISYRSKFIGGDKFENITEVQKEILKKLDLQYEIEKVFDDSSEVVIRSIKRINDEFKDAIAEMATVDLEPYAYEFLMQFLLKNLSVAEELKQKTS